MSMLTAPTTRLQENDLRYDPNIQDVILINEMQVRDYNLTFEFANVNRCNFDSLLDEEGLIQSGDIVLLRDPIFCCNLKIKFPRTSPTCKRYSKFCLQATAGKGLRYQCKLYVVDPELNMKHMDTSRLHSNTSNDDMPTSKTIIDFVPRCASRWKDFTDRFASTDNKLRFVVKCQLCSSDLITHIVGEEEDHGDASCPSDKEVDSPVALSGIQMKSLSINKDSVSTTDSTNSDASYVLR